MATALSDLAERLAHVEQRLQRLERLQRDQGSSSTHTWQFAAEHLKDDRMVLKLWKGPMATVYGQSLRPQPSSSAPAEEHASTPAFDHTTTYDSQSFTQQDPASTTPTASKQGSSEIHSQPRHQSPFVDSSKDESQSHTKPRDSTSHVIASDDEEVAEDFSSTQTRRSSGGILVKRPRSVSDGSDHDADDSTGRQRKKPRKRVSFADEADNAAPTFEPGLSFGRVLVGDQPQAEEDEFHDELHLDERHSVQ